MPDALPPDQRFYQGAFRLAFMVVVAAMLCAVLLLGATAVWHALPYSVVARSNDVLDDNTADPYHDEYPTAPPPPQQDGLIPGGSQIAASIADGITKYKEYNATVTALAAKTFGAPMNQSVIDRRILFERDDDWAAGPAAPAAPTPLTKEITLFGF